MTALKLQELNLVGRRKTYCVKFHSGLNLIYGDEDTGKSSILNLIDYCLGAAKVKSYAELEETGLYCLLQLQINHTIFTIKRLLYSPESEIEVYPSEINQIESVFPTRYYSSFSKKGDLEYFSDFLLISLGFPAIKLKEAPTKETSRTTRLSFRDLFKYCYFDQDEVGSLSILDQKNHYLAVKNQQVFKYIFNILDSEIADLQEVISSVSNNRDAYSKDFTTISYFLRDTEFKSYETLISRNQELKDSISSLQVSISELNEQMKGNSSANNSLRRQILVQEAELKVIREEIDFDEISLNNYIALKKEYFIETQKMEAANQVANHLTHSLETEVDCPLCSSKIKLSTADSDPANDEKKIANEILIIKRRITELDSLIVAVKERIQQKFSKLNDSELELKDLQDMLDEQSKIYISPFVQQIEMFSSKLASLEQELKSNDYLLKVRQKLIQIQNKTNQLDAHLLTLRDRLSNLIIAAPGVYTVLERIGDLLRDFLDVVKLHSVYGISINSRTFLPRIRNLEYSEISSGGVRTLTSIGYLLSLLVYSLQERINHPKLIMIDTIGKYLSKTKKYSKIGKGGNLLKEEIILENEQVQTQSESGLEDATIDELSGQEAITKYTHMYEYILALADKNEDFQAIIVDNDIPLAQLEARLQPYVIAHFDENGSDGLPVGFIDDAK